MPTKTTTKAKDQGRGAAGTKDGTTGTKEKKKVTIAAKDQKAKEKEDAPKQSGMSMREEKAFVARITEHAERFDEMAAAMTEIAKLNVELTDDERVLFSSAYKFVIGSRRTSYRSLAAAEEKEDKRGNERLAEIVKQERLKVEKEIKDVCSQVFNILDTHLIPSATSAESRVFWHKTKGDYNRYLAEFAVGKDRKTAVARSLAAYTAAQDAAEEIQPTDPVRLGVALNFSVFTYEILCEPDRAIKVAEEAFDGALAGLDRLRGDKYKESAELVKLLRDNLTMWSGQMETMGNESKVDM